MLRPLLGADLLWVWEQGAQRHPIDRALLMLNAASPEHTADELTSLTVGQRDAMLLDTRAATFGDRLDGKVPCPACQSELQFSLYTSDLRDRSQSLDSMAPIAVEVDDYEVQARCPDSRDLADAARTGDPEPARNLLLERCVLDARRGDQLVSTGELPMQVVEAVAAAIAEHDPQAEIQVDLDCPDCGHQWQVLLDIASFFWEELASRAPQLLREVHTLARAYGWSETDILAMSRVRRETYLNMIG